MSAALHAAIGEIAARQADLLTEYQILDRAPGINSGPRRVPFLEEYAELEACAATLRRLAGAMAKPEPLITVGPAITSRGEQRRAGLYVPPPAPPLTKVVANRAASWWTRPDANFAEEAERLRSTAIPKETDAYIYGEEERRALVGVRRSA